MIIYTLPYCLSFCCCCHCSCCGFPKFNGPRSCWRSRWHVSDALLYVLWILQLPEFCFCQNHVTFTLSNVKWKAQNKLQFVTNQLLDWMHMLLCFHGWLKDWMDLTSNGYCRKEWSFFVVLRGFSFWLIIYLIVLSWACIMQCLIDLV